MARFMDLRASIMKIMGASFFLIVLNEFLIFLLLAVRKTQIAIKNNFLAATFNFTLNWILIPRWGTFGAALWLSLLLNCLYFLLLR